MNPQNVQLPTVSNVSDALTATQPGERTIFVLKRHPIGILSTYVMCGFVLIVTSILAFIVAPSVFGGDNTRQAILAGALVFVIVAAACVTYALIMTKVYWGNSWILTTDGLTQVTQAGLFKRQSSQLALDNMEDITAEQVGMLTRMFNYGVLKVETAGQKSKFMFAFCPNPNYYAQQIIAAREVFEQSGRAEAKSVYQQPPLPQPATPVEIDSYEVPGGPDPAV